MWDEGNPSPIRVTGLEASDLVDAILRAECPVSGVLTNREKVALAKLASS